MDTPNPFMARAIMGQQRFNRLLGSLGDAGRYHSNPRDRFLELRGRRFEAEVLGTYAGGVFTPAHLDPNAEPAVTTFARELAERWANPLVHQPMTFGGPELLELVKCAAVHHGVACATIAVGLGGGLPGVKLLGIAASVELPTATLGDVYRCLQHLPESMTHAQVVELGDASGLPAAVEPDRIVFGTPPEVILLSFDASGELARCELQLPTETLFDLPLTEAEWNLLRELVPHVLLVATYPGGHPQPVHEQVLEAFYEDAFTTGSDLLRALIHWGNERMELVLSGQGANRPHEGIPRALALLGKHYSGGEMAHVRHALLHLASLLFEENAGADPQLQRGAILLLDELLG